MLSTYLPRLIDAQLKTVLSDHPAVLILGPRAVGKTTGAGELTKVSTRHLLDRLSARLARTRKRLTEADPPHLLEAVTLIVYDPDTKSIDPDLPAPGLGLRWTEFIETFVEAYDLRFE